MQAIALPVAPFEAGGLGQRPEAGLADQQAAREDVGLDEIGIGGVAVEQIVADRDELERRLAAGLEQAGDALEIVRPIFLADRLHHLDAGDGVEPALDVAIIGERDVDLAGEAGMGEPPSA